MVTSLRKNNHVLHHTEIMPDNELGSEIIVELPKEV